MEKYFAKLLPINSAIEIGNPTRVQLFLCSRDIQVGDTVYQEPSNQVADGSIEGCKAKGEGLFKVIGLISPQALWVKEGDEFGEEDVEYWDKTCGKQEAEWYHDMLSKGKLDYLKQYFTIKIKCSNCQTFH